jgi:hypothetical protein
MTGQRPRSRDRFVHFLWPKAILTPCEYGLRPKTVVYPPSWGDAPGYGEEGLRPNEQCATSKLARRVGVNGPMRGVLGNLRVGRNNISGYAELGDTCE